MSVNTTKPDQPQKEAAPEAFFKDPAFVKRYQKAEHFTAPWATDLLDQLGLEVCTEPVKFLDVACGMGIVTKIALQKLQKARSASKALPNDRFTCTDVAPAMLDVTRVRPQLEDWPIDRDQLDVIEASMKDTKLPSDAYTHVVCNFGPCVTSNPEEAIRESYRMLGKGGLSGWSSWSILPWHAHYTKAFADIRSDAAEKCANATASEEDRKLAQLPLLKPNDELISIFVGIDLAKMRASGIPEDDLPRWDEEPFFKSQVEEAGFRDIKIVNASKDIELDLDFALSTNSMVISILQRHWTLEQKDFYKDVDLDGKLNIWWRQHFEKEGNANNIVIWKDCRAMVVTARKL